MDHKTSPDEEFRLFIYDPSELEFTYFKDFDDLSSHAFDLFQSIIADNNGWSEEIDDIVIGVATHRPMKRTVLERPPDDELDERFMDKDGNYWSPDMKEIYEYGIQQILKK